MREDLSRLSKRLSAFDSKASAGCLEEINAGWDPALRPIELFFYLPLEHAESLEYQQKSVNLFKIIIRQRRC
jgi:uncharacterized protein (DUF924 family)